MIRGYLLQAAVEMPMGSQADRLWRWIMGWIANQMALEVFLKIKAKIIGKKQEKKVGKVKDKK